MKHTQQTYRSSSQGGFSLIELLLVLAVIAVITAVVIPKFAGIKEHAEGNSARRTAQIIASTAENARVAGDIAIYEAGDKEQALELLSDGVQGSGLFEGVVFKVSLNDEQRVNVLPYLHFESGILLYDGADEID